MEALLSALGLLIGTLMGMPARAAAASDARKARLGKALFSVVNGLDGIISRGNAILDRIEVLATTADAVEFRRRAVELREAAERQVVQLKEVGRSLVDELDRWSYMEPDPDPDLSLHTARPTNVQKVLSIYEPDLGQHVSSILHFKKNALEDFARHFSENVGALSVDNLQIKEITYIAPDFHTYHLPFLPDHPEIIKHYEAEGTIKLKTVNLAIPSERAEYVSRAKGRLSELQQARERLANLIKQHFEPHHLI